MADRKDRMALLSRFNKLYLQRYEQKSNMNLNVDQWAADALIESYGVSECYDVLEYYFSIAQEPNWNYFAYNTEKIINGKLEVQQDIKDRQQRRILAREWLSE
jgi:dissimilatory sulfite reductase (desulfoviridin) alpha/beta subunit